MRSVETSTLCHCAVLWWYNISVYCVGYKHHHLSCTTCEGTTTTTYITGNNTTQTHVHWLVFCYWSEMLYLCCTPLPYDKHLYLWSKPNTLGPKWGKTVFKVFIRLNVDAFRHCQNYSSLCNTIIAITHMFW